MQNRRGREDVCNAQALLVPYYFRWAFRMSRSRTVSRWPPKHRGRFTLSRLPALIEFTVNFLSEIHGQQLYPFMLYLLTFAGSPISIRIALLLSFGQATSLFKSPNVWYVTRLSNNVALIILNAFPCLSSHSLEKRSPSAHGWRTQSWRDSDLAIENSFKCSD